MDNLEIKAASANPTSLSDTKRLIPLEVIEALSSNQLLMLWKVITATANLEHYFLPCGDQVRRAAERRILESLACHPYRLVKYVNASDVDRFYSDVSLSDEARAAMQRNATPARLEEARRESMAAERAEQAQTRKVIAFSTPIRDVGEPPEGDGFNPDSPLLQLLGLLVWRQFQQIFGSGKREPITNEVRLFLFPLLRDPDQNLRLATLWALSGYELDKYDREALEGFLDEEDPAVRFFAFWASVSFSDAQIAGKVFTESETLAQGMVQRIETLTRGRFPASAGMMIREGVLRSALNWMQGMPAPDAGVKQALDCLVGNGAGWSE